MPKGKAKRTVENGAALKCYQAVIIERFLDSKTYAGFIEDYCNARKRAINGRAFNETDKMIYMDYKKGMTISELVRKYHKSASAIHTSIVKGVRNIK